MKNAAIIMQRVANEIADDADPAVPPRPRLEGIRRLLRCIGNGHRESDSMLSCRP